MVSETRALEAKEMEGNEQMGVYLEAGLIRPTSRMGKLGWKRGELNERMNDDSNFFAAIGGL